MDRIDRMISDLNDKKTHTDRDFHTSVRLSTSTANRLTRLSEEFGIGRSTLLYNLITASVDDVYDRLKSQDDVVVDI